MRIKKIALYALVINLFMILSSGIIRDDVSETKYLELANQKQFDCVGQIFHDSLAAGSTVLFSEKYALTAAHVLLVNDIRMDTIRIKGQTIVSYTPINIRIIDVKKLNLQFKGQRVKVKKIIIHPNFLKNIEKGNCDIAIIEFEEPVLKVKPAKIYSNFDELKSKVVGVGFGASGKANKPDSINFMNNKIAGENIIDQISGPKYLSNKTILSCDFDSESLKNCNKMGSAKPQPLEYISASGDSGGGLFKQVGNEWILVGLCSGVDVNIKQLNKTGYYGQVMNWTRISAFANWINSVTKN